MNSKVFVVVIFRILSIFAQKFSFLSTVNVKFVRVVFVYHEFKIKTKFQE